MNSREYSMQNSSISTKTMACSTYANILQQQFSCPPIYMTKFFFLKTVSQFRTDFLCIFCTFSDIYMGGVGLCYRSATLLFHSFEKQIFQETVEKHKNKVKVKFSSLQALEALRVVRG
jgi:hypothetical protein